jgi:hypothetical protein
MSAEVRISCPRHPAPPHLALWVPYAGRTHSAWQAGALPHRRCRASPRLLHAAPAAPGAADRAERCPARPLPFARLPLPGERCPALPLALPLALPGERCPARPLPFARLPLPGERCRICPP